MSKNHAARIQRGQIWDLAQPVNLSLTTKPYSKLTTVLRSSWGMEMNGNAGRPVGRCPACLLSGPTRESCESPGVIFVCFDVQRGASAIYFGSGELFDEKAIARIYLLLSAMLIALFAGTFPRSGG